MDPKGKSDVVSVFLCHGSADKQFARKLAKDLRKLHVHCWIDEAEIRVGDSLLEKIAEGISDCEFLAVILSAQSVKSKWVKRELEIALSAEIAERQVKVLPLLLTHCKMPAFLKGKVYADFRENYKKGLSSLLGTLIPKSKFDTLLSHSAMVGGTSALISFKDDWDQPMLRRWLPFATTVADIRKINPAKNEGLWVEIHFDGVSHLQRVELFTFKKDRSIRLSFHTDLEELVPKRKDEKTWQDTVEAAQQEIWKHDSTFVRLFDSSELAVNWGGPDARRISAETEVMYYIDGSFGYLMAERTFKGQGALDHYTLEDFHLSGVTLSGVVNKIIEGTQATVQHWAKLRSKTKKS